MNKSIDVIPPETMEALMRYDWPGNIRELQNFVERAVILSHSQHIVGADLRVDTSRVKTLRLPPSLSKKPNASTSCKRCVRRSGC